MIRVSKGEKGHITTDDSTYFLELYVEADSEEFINDLLQEMRVLYHNMKANWQGSE